MMAAENPRKFWSQTEPLGERQAFEGGFHGTIF